MKRVLASAGRFLAAQGRRIVASGNRLAQKMWELRVLLLVGTAAMVLAFWWWWSNWPRLLIVNTGTNDVVLWIDNKPSLRISPTTTENPSAGRWQRLVPGTHALHVFMLPEGTLGDGRTVSFDHGATYLYAPVDSEQCFWLQQRAYGRARLHGPSLRILPASQKFWALPGDIDGWFVRLPTPDLPDRTSSGGVRRVVRQGRCGREPDDEGNK